MLTLVRFTGLTLMGLLVLLSGAWAALSLLYTGPGGEPWRSIMAMCFAVLTLTSAGTLALPHWRWRMVLVFVVAFVGAWLAFSRLEPSNERNWQADVAVLPSATIEGDLITVHNIRNFDYQSETDYTQAYYDRQFDLNQLEGVDLVSVYWMGPSIAHVFLSFAFAGDQHLAISIETRKEQGEGYSTLQGFFRQYELYYVVADERDVVRLRTNYRKDPPEDVYLYRTTGSLEDGRRLFLEYIRKINSLNTQPEFYNTLTSNCTTSIWLNAHVNQQRLPLDWRILVSGYVPEYMYQNGRLETYGLPFAELQQRAYANPRAHQADADMDFSNRIRESMPDPGQP
ncbi:hypothetical protein Kalk_19580 [Ketobacter alkanivorans]|uniref:Lnb N-terminal periplasmic domain-containing protein n=2 Tax=Ketobacter alkanivorans TaxID=1917421 RepID=A0A2K9LRU4_9GAMM|nr:hypothetical protein Kalk_19580 [Ketobacter alkanivorans]